VSISKFADCLVHYTAIRDGDEYLGDGLFSIPLKNNPSIAFGDLTLPNVMVESETRPITFKGTRVRSDGVLLKMSFTHPLFFHQRYLHILFHAAMFLGLAAAAIEDARRFAVELQTPAGPLADVDGFRVDLGRVVTQYRACQALLAAGAQQLGRLFPDKSGLRNGEFPNIVELYNRAQSTNAFVTAASEDIVRWAREIVGTRAFTASQHGSNLERLSREVVLGPLSPVANNMIYREVGQYASRVTFLGDELVLPSV
jgi:alkylation response protein AidB-like acyl-CoA dehydrogenase